MSDDAGRGSRGERPAAEELSVRELVRTAYGLALPQSPTDLGGSSSLNLLVRQGTDRFVVRVYRPYVTAGRLAAIQLVRDALTDTAIPVAETMPTRDGARWVSAGGRLIEVERFVEHDAKMDSWARLVRGLPWLGRIHSVLAAVDAGPEGRDPLFANHVHAQDTLDWTRRGTDRIRGWGPTPDECRLADAADQLAEMVYAAEIRCRGRLPRQLVHGDYWDDNVLLRQNDVVLITDFEFLGDRPRIDDLALTLYFADSTLGADPRPDARIGRLRPLVDAYDSALDSPLSTTERAALPLALARQPLWAIGRWVAQLDDETTARRYAAQLPDDVRRAGQILESLPRWQAGLGDAAP